MINGIKPEMKTTTKLRIKPSSFNEAMMKFCDKLKENCKQYVEKQNIAKSYDFTDWKKVDQLASKISNDVTQPK